MVINTSLDNALLCQGSIHAIFVTISLTVAEGKPILTPAAVLGYVFSGRQHGELHVMAWEGSTRSSVRLNSGIVDHCRQLAASGIDEPIGDLICINHDISQTNLF